MILFAAFLLMLGIVLSLWLKVFALMPVTLLAWAVAVGLAQIDSLSLAQTVVAAFLCGASLQFGYFVGGMFVHHRVAYTKKHAFVATRR